MSGKKNLSVCRGHKFANALLMLAFFLKLLALIKLKQNNVHAKNFTI